MQFSVNTASCHDPVQSGRLAVVLSSDLILCIFAMYQYAYLFSGSRFVLLSLNICVRRFDGAGVGREYAFLWVQVVRGGPARPVSEVS